MRKTRNGFIKNLRHLCLIGVIVLGLMTIVGCDGGDTTNIYYDTNNAPVANAGPDQNVSTSSLVTLDGSGSSDADGDTLTYSWSLVSMPDGSAATLSDSTVVGPTFTADVDGTYVISFVVNDGTADSSPDTVTITATTFSTTDLEGTWYYHELASGDGPDQRTGWEYGTESFDGDGNANVSGTASNGENPSGTAIFQVNDDGILSTDALTNFQGVLNDNRTFMAYTYDSGGGGYALGISVKREPTTAFSTTDLEGTWRYHGLISGDALNQTPGWYRGAFTFDQTGALTNATPITDSLGNSDFTPSSGSGLSLDSDGIVRVPGFNDYRGVMNDNKDMIVAVATMCPGRNTDVCGYNLQIMSKESANSFSTIDLEGTWYFHMLTSGDSPQWVGWVYGIESIDANGNGTCTSITRSDGNTSLASDYTMEISSAGILTVPGSDFYGVMNSQKDTIIGVMTDGGGGYDLIIYTKRSLVL